MDHEIIPNGMMNCQWVCLFSIPLFFQSLLSSNTKKPNRKYLLRFAVVPRVCFPSIGFASAKPIWSRRRWWMVDPFVNLKPKTCNIARDFIGWISLGGRAPEFVLFGLSLWLTSTSLLGLWIFIRSVNVKQVFPLVMKTSINF